MCCFFFFFKQRTAYEVRISDWSSDVCSSDLAMLCIADSAYVESNERRTSCSHAWMKPAQELIRLFEDLPEAIRNTLVVAQRCAVAAPTRTPSTPSHAGARAAKSEQRRVAPDWAHRAIPRWSP